jgi:hypothetical protein
MVVVNFTRLMNLIDATFHSGSIYFVKKFAVYGNSFEYCPIKIELYVFKNVLW